MLLDKVPWLKIWLYRKELPSSSTISRFVYDKKIKSPKPACFRDRNMGDISVFETQYLASDTIWHIGKKLNPNRPVYGRCDCLVSNVKEAVIKTGEETRKMNLLVRRAPIFTPVISWWHANIENCPHDEENYKLMLLSLCENDVSCFVSNPHAKNK